MLVRRTSPFVARVSQACAAVLVAAGLAGPLKAAEEILAFDSTIVVRNDGVLDVTETIRVRAEGDLIKRGIYRDFPTTFVDEAGNSHQVSFRLIGVAKNGAPEPYHTAGNAEGVRIYAGEADVFLSPNVYTYEIHYQTGRQIRFLPDHTELFWNVTGNEWAFPIRQASATVRLPERASPPRWTAYTGRFGERGRDFTGGTLPNGGFEVSTTRTLEPGEGLSVVAEIPGGLVVPPSGLQALYYRYLDNRRFIIGGAGFLGVLIFYIVTWGAVGRDLPKGTVIPLFHPPEGISPALAGYIRGFGWSGWREFTAAAVSLAVKGLMVFEDTDDGLLLSRAGGAGRADKAGLPIGERAILTWIDRNGGRISIDSANGKKVAKVFKTFKEQVERENRHRFFDRNRGYFIVGLALTAGAVGLVLAFGGLREGELVLLILSGFVGVFLGMIVVPVLRVFFGARGVRSVVSAGLHLAVVAFIITVFLTIVGGAVQELPNDFAGSLFEAFLANSFPFVLVAGFAAMNGLFYYLLRAPTAAGRMVMDQIEGLELYIRTAETGRFNLAGAPDFDAGHFEHLLPYAIALDAERPWSDAFAAAFARSHPGETLAGAYAPVWHGGRGWGSGDFGRSMSSAISAAQGSFASAVPAPSSSSSGFGGGGGSGGGGGGGGGGGW